MVRCTGIHNLQTKYTFTPAEKQFLANGLKFIPTPSARQLQLFQDQYLKDDTRGLTRFNRSLVNRLIHSEDESKPSQHLTKFSLSYKNTTLHIPDDAYTRFGSELKLLELYRKRTAELLQQAFLSVTLPRQINFHRDDCTFLDRLINDSDITCKPADKNLGLVLVDTSWYDAELTRMLSDETTYRKFPSSIDRSRNRKTIMTGPAAFNKLKLQLSSEIEKLATKYTSTLTQWYPEHADRIVTYLCHGIAAKDIALPEIYLLIKVHKPKGLCGRPIVPCTRWLTTPASVVVDHLLQDVLKLSPIPWLVKDTKSFVNELEQFNTVARAEDVIITADIGSLYTNIDTRMGLALIKQFLIEAKIEQWRMNMIMDLLTFVMNNSYFSFKDRMFHQIDGTAMGTACAPTYANIVVYMLERIVIERFTTDITLYRRYLDDVFATVKQDRAEAFMLAMNSMHPKLKFEFITHSTEASFLDLAISKGTRFNSDGRFDLRVHQKSMNLYLYIPFNSYHTDAAKRSFIQTELTRYIRNSSSIESYLLLRALFWTRLRDRGYPQHFLTPIFNSIRYVDRSLFLVPSNELLNSPLRLTQSPVSQCLIKRIGRAERLTSCTSNEIAIQQPPVFVIPFTPLSHSVLTRSLLMKYWSLVGLATGASPPIIAYQSYPSIMARLVHQKARITNEQRIGPVLSQAKLSFTRLSLTQAVNPHDSRTASTATQSLLSDSMHTLSPMDIDP